MLIAGERVPGADLANLLSSRINQGQMLVTFADSHSALSVLDVDGMKVRRAWSPVEGGSAACPRWLLMLLRGQVCEHRCPQEGRSWVSLYHIF